MSISKLIAGLFCVALLYALTFLGAPNAAAQTYSSVPNLIHYQGRLSSSDGVNVDGEVSVQVFVYDSSTLGASGDPNDAHVLYAEDQGNVFVNRGTLRFTIGEGSPLGPFMGAPMPLEALAMAGELYVELYVGGERIDPRQRIGMRNAAMNSQYARIADNVSGDFGFNQSNLPTGFSASKITSDTINAARIDDVPAGKITGRIDSTRLPSDIPLSKINGGTLAESVLPDFSADILTGTDPFLVERLPKEILREGNIGFAMGTAGHGDTISAPSGFDINNDNCAWTVGYRNSSSADLGFNDINIFRIYPGESPNPVVTCQVIKDESNSGTQTTCDVDYLVICKK